MVLCLRGIKKSYGSRPVLAGIDLTVAPGEAVCVAGRNAQGKTTLLSIAAGMVKPDAGTVSAEGGAGFVPQEPALLAGLSVREHLLLWRAAFGEGGAGLFAEGRPERRLGLLEHAKKRAGALSGGLQKRLSVCCALAGNPRFLILDEPFAALDQEGGGALEDLLRDFVANDGGILMTSHDPGRIAAVAGRLLVLEQGRFLCEETLAQTLDARARYRQVLEVLSGGGQDAGTMIDDR